MGPTSKLSIVYFLDHLCFHPSLENIRVCLAWTSFSMHPSYINGCIDPNLSSPAICTGLIASVEPQAFARLPFSTLLWFLWLHSFPNANHSRVWSEWFSHSTQLSAETEIGTNELNPYLEGVLLHCTVLDAWQRCSWMLPKVHFCGSNSILADCQPVCCHRDLR